jgi:hypothetical protein
MHPGDKKVLHIDAASGEVIDTEAEEGESKRERKQERKGTTERLRGRRMAPGCLFSEP